MNTNKNVWPPKLTQMGSSLKIAKRPVIIFANQHDVAVQNHHQKAPPFTLLTNAAHR